MTNDTALIALEAYWLVGAVLIVLLLLIDKPPLSWRWLWLPLLALAWPAMFLFVRDNIGSRRVVNIRRR